MVEQAELNETHLNSIDDFIVEPKLRHCLVTQRIPSRLSHALIWEKFGLKKETTRILILLSRESRAFILTQKLDGFLFVRHDCSASWLFDFESSE